MRLTESNSYHMAMLAYVAKQSTEPQIVIKSETTLKERNSNFLLRQKGNSNHITI